MNFDGLHFLVLLHFPCSALLRKGITTHYRKPESFPNSQAELGLSTLLLSSRICLQLLHTVSAEEPRGNLKILGPTILSFQEALQRLFQLLQHSPLSPSHSIRKYTLPPAMSAHEPSLCD